MLTVLFQTINKSNNGLQKKNLLVGFSCKMNAAV